MLELFPMVAGKFLNDKVERVYGEKIRAIEQEKQRKREIERARYAALSKDDKEKMIIEGVQKYYMS